MWKIGFSGEFYVENPIVRDLFRQKAEENTAHEGAVKKNVHMSTRVFNSLWKTVWETFHALFSQNMDIQNPWKSPVESGNPGVENPEEGQKKNRNSVNLKVFHRNPTESTAGISLV